MPFACPSPDALSAYASGRREEAVREVLEQHAAGCPACRDALFLMGKVLGAQALPPVGEDILLGLQAIPVRRRARIRPAWSLAAAALLLAVGLGWARLRMPPSPRPQAPPRVPAVAQGFPAGRLGSPQAPRAYLASGAGLVLQAGARVNVQGGRRLGGEAGTFWVEVRQGEPALLTLPGGTLTLTRGLLSVSLPRAPATVWWLPSAEASEALRGEVWVLEGEVRVEGRLLGPDRKLVLTPEGWQEAPCPPAELIACWEGRALALAALPGRSLVPEGSLLSGEHPRVQAQGEAPAAYHWVTVLTHRHPATEVRFSLPAAGGWHDWTVGLAGKAAASREVIEVAWDGATLSGRLQGRFLFSIPRERVGEELLAQPRSGWGISVWGGSVTVAQSRVMEAR